jgi:dihydroxyacetone kinase-like predicted kinase
MKTDKGHIFRVIGGARGKFWVILSQLFRGFTMEIKEVKEYLPYACNACKATESAYKAL